MSKPADNPTRLLLVDDHEMVRIGLRTLLGKTKTFQVVGEAGTAAAAVTEAVRLKPDVVLMDLRLPDGSGVDACREIRAACAATKVLFLTSYSEDDAVLSSVVAGASGYLLKEIGGGALVRAIESVAAGQSILDAAVTNRVLARMRDISHEDESDKGKFLSPQEKKVLSLVAEGKTNKEIAAALDLSDKTVKNYLSNIFQKLQVSRRTQAAAIFISDSAK
ncbi:MAG: response regulator transcription factor [Nitrospirae bacterium]|nr:MAG: response regulator transcription factor [Nitrospirota bacterium]